MTTPFLFFPASGGGCARKAVSALMLAVACCVSLPVVAQAPPRKHPVEISADRVSIDERKKTHVFEGRVELVQGPLRIRSARLVVQQDGSGFRKGVASGGPDGLALFSHRKGEGEGALLVEGEAKRLEYEADTQTVRLFEQARITHGHDEIRGHFIEYNNATERYEVRGRGETETTGRVRAIIQPK